jgi:molecular chaperone DnaK
LSITHRDVEFGGVRLAHSLGIQLADRAFAPMIRKGSTLPATIREVFRTASALRRADADAVVRIPVVQGERSRAERNRQVGMLEIRPRDVRIDLPAGSEVEVTFEVDTSSLVTVVADVPLVQAQFEAEINLDDVRIPEPEVLRDMLAEAEDRLRSLAGSATAAGSADAQERLRKLDEEATITTARDQVRAAGVDAGAAATAEERVRNLQAELDEIEDVVGLPALLGELSDLLDEAGPFVDRAGDAADRKELAELRRRAGDAGERKDLPAVRELIERTRSFLLDLERRSPDWPVKLFFALREMTPPHTAGPLLRDGEAAIAAGDSRALEAVNQRLVRLLPRDEQQKVIGLVKS